MEMVYLGLLAPGAFSGLLDKQAASLWGKCCPPLHTLKQSHSLSAVLSPQLWLLFSLSVMFDSLATPWTAVHQASLSITNFQSFLELMSIESVMPSNHLILCHPLLLLPSVFPIIRVFPNESVLRIREDH